MGSTTIIGICLLVLGLVLLGIEIHIPGFGVCGICGVVSLCFGIVLTAKNAEQGIMLAIGCIVIIAVMATIFILSMNSKNSRSPIVLKEELNKNPEFIGTEDLDYLIGKEGECVTDLRPMGTAMFEGVELSVKAKGGKYIDHNQKVKVIGIMENRIIVERM